MKPKYVKAINALQLNICVLISYQHVPPEHPVGRNRYNCYKLRSVGMPGA